MGDEILAMTVAAIVAITAAVRWYGGLFSVTRLGDRTGRRVLLAIVPIVLLIGLELVLLHWAAGEVRSDPWYNLLFLLGGAAWLAMTGACLPIVGLGARADALESRNAAAAIAVCGAWTGMMLCYAGGNVGEGPTVWTTFGPAALASAALLILWSILEALSRMADAITIDRDTASGVRVAGFLIAAGLILGRSVAGNWHSWENTLHDFLGQGWPAFAIMIGACVFQIIWRPHPRRSTQSTFALGIVPALLLIGAAVAEVLRLGWPELGRG